MSRILLSWYSFLNQICNHGCLANRFVDTFLDSTWRKRSPIPLERTPRTTDPINFPNPIRTNPTLRINMALRQRSRTLHHLNQPSSQTPRLPIRLHFIPPKQHLLNLPSRETSPIKTLLTLRSLRRHLRPPLPLGQQLRRTRKLPLLPCPPTCPRSCRDLRCISKLVDPSPLLENKSFESVLLQGPFR